MKAPFFVFVNRRTKPLQKATNERAKMNPTYYEYMHSNEWKSLKKSAIERDDRQCQLCGARKDLIVHHKRYPKDLFSEDHIDNLITLCRRCHYKTHEEDMQPDILEKLPKYIPWHKAKDENVLEYIQNHLTANSPPNFSRRINECIKYNVTEMYIETIKREYKENGDKLNFPVLLGFQGTLEEMEEEQEKDTALHETVKGALDPKNSPIWEIECYANDFLMNWLAHKDWKGIPSIDQERAKESLKELR